MDHTGVTPPVANSAPDLAEVLSGPGPFLTVYLTTEADVENAVHRSEVHWKDLRRELAAQGADERAMAAVDPLVPDAHLHGECLAVIATPAGLAHVAYEPEPPAGDVGRWGPLPAVGPLLEWRQSQPTHVLALVDRKGADLFVFRGGGPDDHVEVEGRREYPLAKNKPGGWSQARYQRRAENTWEANADEVATELAALVQKEQPRFVAVAGDVRAVQLLEEALPSEVLELVQKIRGHRTPDGSVDEVVEQITRLVATAVAADTATLLAKFREERNQHDRAADGPEPTLEALSKGQVEVLLVHADPDDTRTAWFGSAPIPVASDAGTLRDLNVDDPRAGSLVDIALRAALGTSAGVRMIPGAGGPTGGVGAILRWRD
ncbi:MAG: hypothetical protein JWP02_2550 [Acidimicrobiales bacterium]|nr:hypothetical protein [Acidimicrobiales bacterium]